MIRPRLLLLCLTFLAASPALCKQCAVIHLPPPTPADTALREGDYEEAEKLYSTAVEKTPADEAALSGLVLSQLYQQHIDAALTSVQDAIKHLPSSALLQADLAEVHFRQGHLPEARAAFERAIALDACNPRIYFVESRYLRAHSMYASARDRINTAHQLSPNDPQITSAWMATQPAVVRTEALKARVEDKNAPGDQNASAAAHLQDMEAIHKAQSERGKCRVVSHVTSIKMPFTWIMRDASHIEAFALDVRINDKATARLQIDTGASGILIRRGIAQKAGLVPLVHTKILGIGDQDAQNSYLAMADDLKIGQFEFQNCPVEVSDSRRVVDEDGLIGGDVFRDYLLTIDFPDRSLAIDPLPQRPADDHAASLDGTGFSDDSTPHDAYIAPEMKDWTRVLRFGHDLLVQVGLGDSKTRWFVLDTGAFATSLSPEAARAVTKVSHDPDFEIKGLNGKVKDVLTARNVEVTFGNVRQRLEDAAVFNLDKESRATGFDISGFLGFGTLQYLTMQIDYRDGLVHFKYDPKHGTNRLF